MNSLSQTKDELSFLIQMNGDRSHQYRSASWLLSQFNENVWHCEFTKGIIFDLDFHVRLEDGTLLTDSQHVSLLETLKCWLCVQSHFDSTGGVALLGKSAFYKVTLVLRLIDYFLLNSARFELAKYGLEIITESDIKYLITDLASSNESVNSVYRWNEKLTQYLKECSSCITLTELEIIHADQPMLMNISDAPKELDLTEKELTQARAYLWINGFYDMRNERNYRLSPNSKKLSFIIYANTIGGKFSKHVPDELCAGPIERYSREYYAVPVNNSSENRLSKKTMEKYRTALRNLGLLAEIGLPVPIVAMNALSEKAVFDTLNLKPEGRTQTLPQSVVFPALRNGLEFILEYGDDLVDSYLALVRAACKMGMDCNTYSMRHDISQMLTPKVQAMGVHVWHLVQYMVFTEDRQEYDSKRPASSIFFRRFRANEGLFELLQVLYGAIELCVGILMARRQGELLDLIAGKCLDRSQKHLVFDNRKSGIEGKREKEARPIPVVAVRMVKMIERLQTGLLELGKLNNQINLFARPDRTGMRLIIGTTSFNEALDSFCDYFETPLNSKGQRYYIRQHQFRRFFAMLFFWGRSFGGMDTLRWFLGHTDVEHLYYYITETTPGSVLQSVKATYATEQIQELAEGSEALADLIEKHFGTRKFSVLDSEELEAYIEFLLEDDELEIEPEFFETADGQSYKVLIKVKGVSQ